MRHPKADFLPRTSDRSTAIATRLPISEAITGVVRYETQAAQAGSWPECRHRQQHGLVDVRRHRVRSRRADHHAGVVSERVAEIGVRMQQFLIEAVLVCALGGAAGIAVAIGFGAIFNAVSSNFTLICSDGSIMLALRCSCLIGVAFGFMPARFASRSGRGSGQGLMPRRPLFAKVRLRQDVGHGGEAG
jgi:hypothetical protein